MGSPAGAVSFLTDLTSWHRDTFNPDTTDNFDTTALHGLKVKSSTAGRMICDFPVNKRVQNRFGTLHGGCIGKLISVRNACCRHEHFKIYMLPCTLCICLEVLLEHDLHWCHQVYAAATLVDDVSSGAIRSVSEHPGVSVHISINYFSPTPGGQDCEVDSRVTKAGRTLAFAEVQSIFRAA